MKTIEIGEHKIELDIGEVLTVKEFRKIYPLLKQYADNEIEMVIAIIKSFTTTDVEGIIDGLSIEDFTKLSEQIVGLIDQKKKIDEINNLYNQEALKKGAKRMSEEIIMLSIMEQYGWSYEDYMNTPNYIIEVIKNKNNTDFKLSKMK